MEREAKEGMDAFHELCEKHGGCTEKEQVLSFLLYSAREVVKSLGFSDEPHIAKILVDQLVATWNGEYYSTFYNRYCQMSDDMRMQFKSALEKKWEQRINNAC